jgi:two-component system, NtrC family, sensor kinase
MRGPYFFVCRFWRSGMCARENVSRSMLFFMLLLVLSHGTAQRSKIDSLKNRLPLLSDSARVDCFNSLSLLYTYIETDSATAYQQEAFHAATAAGYIRGSIMALNNKAHIAGMCLHDFPLQEQLSLQTIREYSSRADKSVMASTYMNLALALFCQSYFDRAAAACDSVMQLARQSGNKKQLGEGIAIMGSISFESGNYEKSFEYFNQSLSIFKSIGDAYNTAILLAKLGDIYGLAGDRKAALDFYFQSLKYPKGSSLVWHPLVDLGDTYYATQRYDSAFYDQDKYMQTIKSLTIRSNYVSFPKVIAGEMSMNAKDYDKALPLLLESLNTSTKSNDQNQLMRSLLDIAKIYTATKNNARAFYYTKKLLGRAQDRRAKQYLRDGYQLMYTLYDQGHQTDSAYYYYRQYTSMKNIMALDDFNKKIAIYEAATENEKKQLQISALTNEKLLGQQKLELSEQKLQNESFLRNILIAGVLILLLFGFVLYRNNKLKQKSKVKIEKAYNDLKSTQRQLIQSEKMASLGELTAGIAHEIQNPLNFVNNFSELNNELIEEMMSENDIDAVKTIAGYIKQNNEKITAHGKRADAIVKGMMQHSSSGSGVKELTDINGLCDEYLRLSYHGMRAKDKNFDSEISTIFDPVIDRIEVIPQDIGRVLQNLINNAFYSVNEKRLDSKDTYRPRVALQTNKINNKVTISVTDNGKGMPSGIVDKIFQPFFTTKPTGQGTGLGLSISYDIIKSHGGEIKVKSNEGEGSEFVIELVVA